MPDVFDEVAEPAPTGDVFDRVAAPAGDVFDAVAGDGKLRMKPPEDLSGFSPEQLSARQFKQASELGTMGAAPEPARQDLGQLMEPILGIHIPRFEGLPGGFPHKRTKLETAAEVTGAVGNSAAGLVEGLLSPAVIGTAGAGVAIPAVGRTLAGLWAAKMASDLPEQAVDTYGAYKLDAPLYEKIEKPLSLAGSALFTGLAGRHAMTRGVPLPESIRALQEKTAEPPAQPPVAEPVAEPVETETQWRVKGSGPVEVVDRNEAKKLALVRFSTGQTRTVPFSELYSVQVEKESGFRAQPNAIQEQIPLTGESSSGKISRATTRDKNKLQTGTPSEPEGGPKMETKLSQENVQSGLEASTTWLESTARGDRKASEDAALQLTRLPQQGGRVAQQTVLEGADVGGTTVRAPSDYGTTPGAAVENVGTRSPQERQRVGQSSEQSSGFEPIKSLSDKSNQQLGKAFQKLREVSQPETQALGARALLDVLSKEISDEQKVQILSQVKDVIYASSQQAAAKVYGAVRAQPIEGEQALPAAERSEGVQQLSPGEAPGREAAGAETKPPVPLTEAEAASDAAERAAIDQGTADNKAAGLPADVEIRDELPGGNPFARIIATIDKTGKILINRPEFRNWLERDLKGLSPERRRLVIQTLFSEEGIHSIATQVVTDAEAADLWNSLSGPERALVRKSYTGKFRGADISDSDMGHEYLRRTLQRLWGTGTREMAESKGFQRLSDRTIDIIERVILAVRRAVGSKASTTLDALVGKLQAEIDAQRTGNVPQSNVPQSGGPSARRRGKDKPEDPAQDPLNFLPPVPGHPGTEPTFATTTITPSGLDRVLTEHLAKDRPNFKGFRDELEQQFPGVQKGQLKEAWRDAVWKNLMGRPGAELSKLAERLGLRESVGRTIADAPTPEATVPFGLEAEPSGEIRGRVERVKRESREDASTATAVQHSRQNAIARIGEKLIGQAETEQRTFRRTSVTPDDIGWWREKEGIDPFREIKEADRKDPKALGELLTRGGAEDRTGRKPPPETVTKRVTAFVDKTTGKVELVSTYRTARGNVYVRDPVSTAAKNNHVLLNKLLARNRYKAIYSALLDEPVKGFRQTFSSLADFKGEFVERAQDIAQARKESAAEHPALQTEGRPPEPPGVLEKGHEAPMTDAEAGALLDHIKAEVGELTERSDLNDAVDALTTRADENRLQPRDYQVINALQKAVRETEKANPKLKGTNEAIDQTLDRIYRDASASHTRADFVARTLGQAPRPVRPVPPGKATGSAPAAFRRQRDAFETFLQTAAASLKRSPTHGTIAYTLDAAEHKSRNVGQAAMRAIEVFSGSSGKRRPIFSQARKGQETAATALREEAIAIIQGGNDPARLRDFINRANNGINNARNAAATPGAGLFEKRRARRWEETATELKDIATRALANVGNARLQRLAQEGGNILRTQLRDERRSGINIRSIDDYVPGRYDPEFFNDNGVWFGEQRVLGRHYKSPKQFESYWHAIENGPYIPKKFDLADLVGHRVRQGRMEMGKNLWVEGGKTLIDPDSGEPVVRDLVPSRFAPSRMVAPTPEYELFSLGPGKATVSVRVGFKDLYDTLTLPSTIAKNPVGHAALWATGLLKHGVMLILDTFHPGRLIQFGLGGMLNEVGYRKGYAALELREQDMARAVQTGMITQAEADWATGSVTVTRGGRPVTMTRQELLQEGQSKGLNVGRVTDAIYTHFFDSYPVIGRFNRWVFDRFTRGLMAQQFVTDVLRLNEKFPNKDFDVLARDVARDVNFTYGNIGRQGLIRNATIRDITQIALLAPQWFESLVQKELRFAYRLARAPDRFVRGEIPLGSLGRTMGRGLAGYFLLTQAINLMTRGQLTFKNDEEGHKLDAWIPDVTGKTKGFFLSPLSVFAEVLHDVIRLTETKPKVVDAIRQIGENKLGPWGKMAMVFATGKSPEGNTLTSSGAVAKHMALQLAPAPISIGKFAREAAHAAAPTLIAPNRPGTVQRQLFGSGGVKIEAAASSTARIARKAQDFLKSKGLEKTGTVTEFTEDPSYVKLRQALRNSDGAAVKEIVGALKKTHTPQQLIKSLLAHTRFPFTGRALYEQAFIGSLSPADREVYRQARLEQVEELKKLPALLHDASE